MYKYLNHGKIYALRVTLRNIRAIFFLLLTISFFIIPPKIRLYYYILVGLCLIIIFAEFNRNKKQLFLSYPSLLDYLIMIGTNIYIDGITILTNGFNSPLSILTIIPTFIFTFEFGIQSGLINLIYLWLFVIASNLFQQNIGTVSFLNSIITIILASLTLVIIRFYHAIISRYQQKIIRLLFRDELTGLFNRRFLKNELLEEIIQRNSFFLIMLDINYFKLFNDQWGHSMGDSLLIYVGRVLKKAAIENDIVARISGDEFVIFKPQASLEIVENMINRIKIMIEENHFPGEECFPQQKLSLSFGIVEFPEQATSYEELMRVVDYRMYQDKKQRN